MAQTQRVSFQELKEKISMSDLLAYYGLLASLQPRRDGEELVGLCPFHQETRGIIPRVNGQERLELLWLPKEGEHP